ncbi:lysoplasmalogenase [Cellulomonas sp. P22]|uniref:lysoplasmalogenase n=1 Tax=Cellulomonas sp. P22 TaxID=3373189 RepID=UPI0037ADD554
MTGRAVVTWWGGRSTAVRGAVTLYAVVVVAHLVGQVVGARGVADATQWALMPLLALVLALLVPQDRGRRVTLVLVALGFSWLGDTLPDVVGSDASFRTMVGSFLLAQITYLVAFVPVAHRTPFVRRPWLALPYVGVLVGLVGACAPAAGSLLVPLVVYGVCLVAMAMAATGVHRLTGIGGAVFLVSDALIALRAFADLEPPLADLWVMATYVAGQTLIVAGVVAARRPPGLRLAAPAPGARSRSVTGRPAAGHAVAPPEP